jgi:hypothetical protein
VKPLALLLLAALLPLTTSCTTLANRRDLYKTKKQQGPYTEELRQVRESRLRGYDWSGQPPERAITQQP